MKRFLVFIAFVLASAPGKTYAQFTDDEEDAPWRKLHGVEWRFNMQRPHSIRDIVNLEKGNKIIFETYSATFYSDLHGLDTMLRQLNEDISFYRDSLENGSASVRIDYLCYSNKPQREMRFLKHMQNGEPFVKIDGTIERLKIEQDTVHIVMMKLTPVSYMNGRPYEEYIGQVTLVLNNYTDINSIASKPGLLRHAMDTLIAVRKKREVNKPIKYPSSYILSKTDTGGFQLRKVGFARKAVALYANVGAGVVRNTLTPFADLGVSLLERYPWGGKRYFFTSLSASPFFFFERGADRTYYMHDNWFVNLERGGVFGNNILGFKAKEYSYGISYLAINKGSYFKDITVKFFITATLINGITLSPELIATNTFGQFFPGGYHEDKSDQHI